MRNCTRVSANHLPGKPARCQVKALCVYRGEFSVCGEPRINKGNGDAACHKMNNRDLLVALESVDDDSEQGSGCSC